MTELNKGSLAWNLNDGVIVSVKERQGELFACHWVDKDGYEYEAKLPGDKLERVYTVDDVVNGELMNANDLSPRQNKYLLGDFFLSIEEIVETCQEKEYQNFLVFFYSLNAFNMLLYISIISLIGKESRESYDILDNVYVVGKDSEKWNWSYIVEQTITREHIKVYALPASEYLLEAILTHFPAIYKHTQHLPESEIRSILYELGIDVGNFGDGQTDAGGIVLNYNFSNAKGREKIVTILN